MSKSPRPLSTQAQWKLRMVASGRATSTKPVPIKCVNHDSHETRQKTLYTSKVCSVTHPWPQSDPSHWVSRLTPCIVSLFFSSKMVATQQSEAHDAKWKHVNVKESWLLHLKISQLKWEKWKKRKQTKKKITAALRRAMFLSHLTTLTGWEKWTGAGATLTLTWLNVNKATSTSKGCRNYRKGWIIHIFLHLFF